MIDWIRRLLMGNVVNDVLESFEEPNHDLPDFDNMTKLEIDIWARNNLGIDLDRRRTKKYMIDQIHKHLEKES